MATFDLIGDRNAEEKVRRSEAFLAEGHCLSRTGSFSWRVETDEVTFSEEAYRIFEFDRGSPVTLQRIASRIHPEDSPLLSEKIAGAQSRGDDHAYEVRLRMPDGSVKHLHMVSHATRDPKGRFEYIGAIHDVTQRRAPDEAVTSAQIQLDGFDNIIGGSVALESVLAEVGLVAQTDSTVLVLGETGTGKELIARAVHKISSRRGRPFVKLNCAAIPFDLLESELFGHEKGAFTGAVAQKVGRFEMADTGTLFLDEIGDIPLALQPKLLRVLQDQEFERLGSCRTHRINVRMIAATHQNLTEMVRRNEFRSDLYYRLNVFPVVLPPLRERREDIAQLVWHFVGIFARKMGKQITQIPQETLDAFISHPWPGNVRELQNLIERAVILSSDDVLPNPLPTSDSVAVAATFKGETFIDSQRALMTTQLRNGGKRKWQL